MKISPMTEKPANNRNVPDEPMASCKNRYMELTWLAAFAQNPQSSEALRQVIQFQDDASAELMRLGH
ncbi:hypothetical protein Leryth_000123, partial [Lithospermum erythrorhizon]